MPARPDNTTAADATVPVRELRERFRVLDAAGELTLRDAHALRRRLERARGLRDVSRLTAQLAAAERRYVARAAAVPELRYPDLPVSGRRADLEAAIRENQVVVVAGETGSGKTTQLPKICLGLGRGVRGTIAHTQPRRLAARTVAQRIADETGTPLGETVGFTVRFTDHASDRTLVRLMTDGILLAQVQRDPLLLAYDTVIVDEAHERSLNVDFLLGYLRELLPRRPDLKTIVTSATIEPERFAAYFGDAPVVEVSGRTYPVELRYRPLIAEAEIDGPADADDDPPEARDRTEAILDAVAELDTEPPGDVLVFLSGEREIRDTADALAGRPGTEVLPLYARLAAAEQQRVWTPTGPGLRRVVLATNVAETSLTVPGIRYVIDPGTARISRYSRRTKVQRLPIEAISQASASQRAGRCGRVAAGVCIRLYAEEDLQGRPRYTEPEILRTNLAAVILQMAALGLGDVEAFPFLDPPDRRSVRDGVALLQELGAFGRDGRLTDVGRRLARLPLDPRLARMIIAADHEGCVREILVLAAALSIPDPRERPAEHAEAARAAHARFADEASDFVTLLNLWNHLREQRRERSGNAFRRLCREEYLHYLRVREWQDLVGQLRSIARDLGIVESDEPADAARVHAALLTGLLGHVGLRDDRSREERSREFRGTHNTRFVVAPGSVLARRPPRWVVVAELVETSRLFGRTAARVDPEAVERAAGQLVHREYDEPHWDAQRGAAVAFERVTLYGLPLVTRRRIALASVDPAAAREMFVQHALVEGDWESRHRFLHDNRRLRADLERLEDRVRRRGLLAGDDEVRAFYEARIPPSVVSARHFDEWWKKARHRTPDLLTMTRDDLLRHDGDEVDDALTGLPDTWHAGDLDLPVTYRFEPGAADDGVTVHVPAGVLARLGGGEFSWQVPALREELVTSLIRSLPKELRRSFVPAPDTARAVLAELAPDGEPVSGEPLLEGMQRVLQARTGVLVPLDAFDLSKVPAHLRVTVAVEDAQGAELARGTDVAALQQRLAAPVRTAVAAAVAGDLERSGLAGWPADLEELPREVTRSSAGHTVRGYPALVAEAGDVAVRVLPTASMQAVAMPLGTRTLLRRVLPSPVRALERALSPRERLGLGDNPDGSVTALLDDCADAAVDALMGEPAWTRAGFDRLRHEVGNALPGTTRDVLGRVATVLAAARGVRLALPDRPPPAQADAVAQVREQLAASLRDGFVARTGNAHLTDLARWLTAAGRRIDALPRDPATDSARAARVQSVRDAYDDLVRALPPARAAAADVQAIARMIEELRVSLWAQQLGTPRPVSEQRIYRAIDAVRV